MSRTTTILSLVLALLGWLTAVPAAVAFAPQGALDTLREADRAALETIAAYPGEARDAVLEAALHPETLVEMELIQARYLLEDDLELVIENCAARYDEALRVGSGNPPAVVGV